MSILIRLYIGCLKTKAALASNATQPSAFLNGSAMNAGSTAAIPSSKIMCASKKRGSRETFVILSHPPGHAQADFGEALVVIGGVEQKAYFFALDLPHSEACYVRAYPAANTEDRKTITFMHSRSSVQCRSQFCMIMTDVWLPRSCIISG
mgnify:CR=1 FL=1